MSLHIGVLLAAILSDAPATAADACPATGPNVEWAASCFEADDTGRRVKQQYVGRLRLDNRGHTTIVIGQPRELVAVNRQGKVVVPGIFHTGDFDFKDAQGGIGRFQVTQNTLGSKAVPKCGYFDSRDFRIVIPAEYAQCRPFADGEAIACKDCVSLCMAPECQHSVLVNGEGVTLGPEGTVRRRFRLPDMKTVCAKTSSEQREGYAYKGTASRCAQKMENPFK